MDSTNKVSIFPKSMKKEENLAEEIFDLVLNQLTKPDEKVVNFASPEEILNEIPIGLKPEGEDLSKLLDYMRDYIKYSVKTGDKKFQNQLYQGFNLPAFIGEVVTAFTNTSMYTYEVAPVASLMEIELIRKMCGAVGYENGDGIFVTGGSNANLIAMFTARNVKYPAFKTNGPGNKVFTAFINKDAHYSFKNSANLLGLGTKNLHLIDTDEDGRMDTVALRKAIVESKNRGEIPFFIGATAATTMRAAYDPIEALSTIAEEMEMWLHVDGSFGGSIVLSEQNRGLVKGIEKVNSVAWNPHKLMNIPLVCSVVLMKERGLLEFNNSDINTDYIYHENETQEFDLGKKSVQCGRRVDALKLWCAWKCLGDNGYQDRIDKLIDNATYFEGQVNALEDFELLAKRQSFSVCFRVKVPDVDLNELNIDVRENLRLSGELLLNYGYVEEDVALRFVSVNPALEKNDIDEMLESLVKEAKRLQCAQLN